MNHSESNLNKLFNQCCILVPDLDNSLSKGLFWLLPLLFRGSSLSSWLSLMVWPQSLHPSAPLCRRVPCRALVMLLPSPMWLCIPAHSGPTELPVPLRQTHNKGLFALIDFPWDSGVACHGSACAQNLQTGHDPCSQPHGPEHQKGNTGEECWREDPAGDINAETFCK